MNCCRKVGGVLMPWCLLYHNYKWLKFMWKAVQLKYVADCCCICYEHKMCKDSNFGGGFSPDSNPDCIRKWLMGLKRRVWIFYLVKKTEIYLNLIIQHPSKKCNMPPKKYFDIDTKKKYSSILWLIELQMKIFPCLLIFLFISDKVFWYWYKKITRIRARRCNKGVDVYR